MDTVPVGESLTAVILIVAVSLAVKVPPVPLLPKSLAVNVRVTLAGGASLAMMKVSVPLKLPASRLLICAKVPLKVTVLVPDPPTVTPVVPAVAVKVPEVTLTVAWTVPLPASTSAMLKPVPCKVRLTCSVAL
ncbi:hypothetical protein AQB9606_04709 [Aquabacterium sp. CECT 9606]|nr:hypothetical protein AQB9606_04709 [Aquabacterium sp. CECT 9606]